MATNYGTPPIVTDSLLFMIDPANPKSYTSGSATITDMIGNVSADITNCGFSEENFGVLTFNGTDTDIDMDDFDGLTTDGGSSISLWFKGTGQTTTLDYSNQFFSVHASDYSNILRFGIAKTSGGIFYRIGSGTGVIGSSNYDNSVWYNITLTKVKDSAGTVYVNASSIGSTPSTNLTFDDAVHYSIGQEYDPGPAKGDFFKGQISCVQIYNKVLTQAEVTQNYNALKLRFE